MTQPAITLDGPDLRRIADVVLADLLPSRLRRKWLSRMGRMAIAQAKKNVREQKTVDSSPMAPRKRKPPKMRPVYHRSGSVTYKKTHDKMLVDLVKSCWLGMDLPDENTARVKFFRGAGIVARKHQLGGRAAGAKQTGINYRRAFDWAKIPESLKGTHFALPDGSSGCSAHQAATLIRLDYIPPRLRKAMPGGGSAALEYLMRNISRKLAIFLIAEGVKRAGKTKLPDGTPARPFLGLDEPQMVEMGDAIMAGIYDRFKAANHKNLLK